MNRTEFLEQLERLLWDIPESERKEALEYYQDYFEDAGAENEGKVIQELGSPGKVAAIIRSDLENEGIQYGEYTETGYTDERFQEKKVPEPSEMKENSERSETGQEENNWDGTRYRDPQGREGSTAMTALTAEPDTEEITDRIQDVPEAEPAGSC